jgi:hypothetical protein
MLIYTLMKYLKQYSLFESNVEWSDISKDAVEELFYSLSDDNPDIFVDVQRSDHRIHQFDPGVTKLHNDRDKFGTPKEYDGIKPSNRSSLDRCIVVCIRKPYKNSDGIAISTVSVMNSSKGVFDVKDDIQFAINYLEKEYNLHIAQIFVSRFSMYREKYPSQIYYKDFNAFLKDYNKQGNVISIALYFS